MKKRGVTVKRQRETAGNFRSLRARLRFRGNKTRAFGRADEVLRRRDDRGGHRGSDGGGESRRRFLVACRTSEGSSIGSFIVIYDQ